MQNGQRLWLRGLSGTRNNLAYAASTVPRRLLYRSSHRRAHSLNLAPIVASFCGNGQIEPAVVGKGAQEVAEVLQAHAAQGLGLQNEIALIARLAEAHGGVATDWPEGTIELPMPLFIS